MKLSAFDFELPEQLIALRPAVPRRAARLLVVDPAENDETPPRIRDQSVQDLPGLLRPGDCLVFNDTKVIPARLFGERRRKGSVVPVEALLIAPAPDQPEGEGEGEGEGESAWRALARPGKRLALGDPLVFSYGKTQLEARVGAKEEGGVVVLSFLTDPEALRQKIATLGAMPLPPYIAARREADAQDRDDYQTIFAARDGAVAAPTAALHFDAPLLQALAERGVDTATLTLHVGPGTFLPVKTDDVSQHVMHGEQGELSAATAAQLNRVRAGGGRVIAVGTTSLRLLETAVDEQGRLQPWSGVTDLFITPGFQFRAADMLMTNFHLPKSTLFMLVSAFAGQNAMRAAYAHAIQEQYRFYSYGDSSLLGLKQG